MDKELIERLWCEALNSETPKWPDCIDSEVRRFAQLIAEECAKMVCEVEPLWPREVTSWETDKLAAAIRAKFTP